jgi:hypothetical protein
VLWTFGPAIVEALQLPSEDALARDFWDSKAARRHARAIRGFLSWSRAQPCGFDRLSPH